MSSGASFIPILLLFLILYYEERNKKVVMRKIIEKRKENHQEMIELAKKFIGKECIVYTFNSQLEGVLKEVGEGGILMEKKGVLEAVNFDFIVRIREYPRNKSGKKKSVVID